MDLQLSNSSSWHILHIVRFLLIVELLVTHFQDENTLASACSAYCCRRLLSDAETFPPIGVLMEDSTQENDKIQGRGIEKYAKWTLEESNELLKLMVDAANRGWCDTNGVFSKITVEKHILPHLNQKLGVEKTYAQYKSRVKWFKSQYNKYSKLMRHDSGFGWDHVTKKFTASDEVWDDYFMSHP
ncbi:unnamed protein product [Fraxinus pennsylvanica]|uniref:Myb/SANT-like domain-containing protein n=1 Tax=Fraxinus pennsylvanica TaxID=56036 RepID=A0AAD2A8M6_9LAMI|nr:unnamed protein product [Fraxinus pennsylvanica]